MKSIVDFLNEGLSTVSKEHIEHISNSLEKNNFQKIDYPQFPVDCWIMEDDWPMWGNKTLKEICTNFGITYKMKKKPAEFNFKDKYAVLDIDNEEKWKIFLILNRILARGRGYNALDGGISTDSKANDCWKKTIGSIDIF